MNVVARLSATSGARHFARAQLSTSSSCQHVVKTGSLLFADNGLRLPRAPPPVAAAAGAASATTAAHGAGGARSLWTLANRPGRAASPVHQSQVLTSLQQHQHLQHQLQRKATPTAVGVQQRRHFVGPVVRALVQVGAAMGVVFLKAFAQAFAQAQANAKNPKAAGATAAETMGLAKKSMDLGQSYEVLNLKPGASRAEVEERFKKYFDANDPDNGGSFYLQSKVLQAKYSILNDMGVSTEEQQRSDGTGPGGDGGGGGGGGGGSGGGGGDDPVYKEQPLRKD
jgi:import inner membrane translocase subunit TIM16